MTVFTRMLTCCCQKNQKTRQELANWKGEGSTPFTAFTYLCKYYTYI